MKEEYSRSPTSKLQKEIQEAKKHIPQLQEQLSKATGGAQVRGASRHRFQGSRHRFQGSRHREQGEHRGLCGGRAG